jgi:hypothetical protein
MMKKEKCRQFDQATSPDRITAVYTEHLNMQCNFIMQCKLCMSICNKTMAKHCLKLKLGRYWSNEALSKLIKQFNIDMEENIY